MNVRVISERLGHSNIKITLGTYYHVLLPTV
ncbi:integrase [Klebsiella pneumoniae]|nr:integrase [Klebsiella pneumoniae]